MNRLSEEDLRSLELSVKEVESAAVELREAWKRGSLSPGLVTQTKDIFTRFTIPRLEDLTEGVSWQDTPSPAS